MCCFFGPGATLKSSAGAARPLVVENTMIFARRAGTDSQILAYQMALSAGDAVAMVLPLPVGSRDEKRALTFLSLERCADLFTRIKRKLPVWEAADDGEYDRYTLGIDAPVRPRLDVQMVGSFEASFVPSVADFDRLDPRFRVAPELWAALGDYADWGFAVFQLRDVASGRAAPVHPMAFRFVTRQPESLFFPTVHVHDGSVRTYARFDHHLSFQADVSARYEERWFVNGRETADHALAPEGRKGHIRWNNGSVGPRELYGGGLGDAAVVLDPELPMHAVGMKDMLPNRDTWLRLDAPWN
jgi:hypothetical protein